VTTKKRNRGVQHTLTRDLGFGGRAGAQLGSEGRVRGNKEEGGRIHGRDPGGPGTFPPYGVAIGRGEDLETDPTGGGPGGLWDAGVFDR